MAKYKRLLMEFKDKYSASKENVAKVLKDTDFKSKLKRFKEDNNNFTSRFTNENKTLLSNYRKKLRR